MTLAAIAATARGRLETAGFDKATASRDAVLLARWVLGWGADDWLTRNRETPPPHFAASFESLLTRRATSEPIAYLTGEREFYGRTFKVTPDVLIPRPETEFVVEEALRLLGARDLQVPGPEDPGLRASPLIVDVGTGSGCIAITLALEVPGARIVATDISAPALKVAEDNARAHGALDRIAFAAGAFLAGMDEPVDLFVSNPPYVSDRDRQALPAEVVGFEPATALFGGGADGLDMIRVLLSIASGTLAPGGALVMEIGAGQCEAVEDLIADNGLHCARVCRDLQNIPRVVVVTPEAS
jgi:release factor glutamine methyltransferase